MPRPFAIAAAVSALVLAGSLVALTSRLVTFYREHPPTRFIFQDLDTRSFSYAGRDVSLTDEMSEAGDRFLVVRYGDDALRLRVAIPHRQHEALKDHGLAAHRDWMRALRFVEATAKDPERVIHELKLGNLPDRLVIVTRTPRAGVDPATWGEVFRKDWTFDFYEFKPEGGFETQRLHYPTNRRGEPAKPGELREGTWQWDAALLTMPKAGLPAQNFVNTGFKAMGWTFPAACLSSVALAVSLVMVSYRPKAKPAPLPV